MDKGYAAAIAYLLIFFLFSRINIYITLHYRRNQSDDYVAVEVRLLRNLMVYQVKVPVVKFTRQDYTWLISEIRAGGREKTQTYPQREKRFVMRVLRFYIRHPRRIRKLFSTIRYYRRVLDHFMDRILQGMHCEYFEWRTRLGSEDAALTGVGIGAVWALKQLLLQHLSRRIGFDRKPLVSVTPAFGENRLDTELTCIFRLRLGNVIGASTRLLTLTRKEAVTRG
ncbi:MAG: DUF2953 domain-containing protein [Negativicutes bacterium]|nr:DUF2953 domain-containing protein [Negativicutes bacterium]